MDLIEHLIKNKWLKTPEIISAFKSIKRSDFLTEETLDFAEANQALPLMKGQTISQPLTVAFMLELLKPEKQNKILDIGSGSGWTTCLLSHIVKQKGKVIAIEIIPELLEFGKQNTLKYNFIKKGIAEFILGDGKKGCLEQAPFDRILCSASSNEIPQAFKDQIKVGGRIVIPIKSSIFLIKKISKNKFQEKEFPGFAFVPLV